MTWEENASARGNLANLRAYVLRIKGCRKPGWSALQTKRICQAAENWAWHSGVLLEMLSTNDLEVAKLAVVIEESIHRYSQKILMRADVQGTTTTPFAVFDKGTDLKETEMETVPTKGIQLALPKQSSGWNRGCLVLVDDIIRLTGVTPIMEESFIDYGMRSMFLALGTSEEVQAVLSVADILKENGMKICPKFEEP